MSKLASRWMGNSAANVLGGAGAALFNLALPALMSRRLGREDFGAWSLAVQVMIYISLLGLGLQTAAARAVAHANENDDMTSVATAVKAGRSISRWAMAGGAVLTLLMVVLYPTLFPSMPPEEVPRFRWMLAALGLSAAWQLEAQTPMGVFQGLHRNIGFVIPQLITRAAGVAAIAIALQTGGGLIECALAFAIASAGLPGFMWHRLRSILPAVMRLTSGPADPSARKRLLADCWALSVWNVSMLLVNSVGILMVGRIAFGQSGAYSIAMSAATVLAGLIGAVLSPLLTTAAALHATDERRAELPELLIRATQWCSVALQAIFFLALLLHRPILHIWVGEKFEQTAAPLLVILVGAHALRNVASPYSLMLLATGLNRRALWTGVAEGASNLCATILLGLRFGATGVAFGTLVGAVVGIVGTLVFNTPRTPEITPSPWTFAMRAWVLPLLAWSPVYGLLVYFS